MIPGSGRSAGEGIGYPLQVLGFPCGSVGYQSAHSAGELGSIPGLGRSPTEGNGYPLQYSGLENSMDCIVHGVAKSRTRLSDFHFVTSILLWRALHPACCVCPLFLWVQLGLAASLAVTRLALWGRTQLPLSCP